MAFKITPFYNIDNTPIYHVDMEDGVLGKANNNGTIILNKNLDPNKKESVIAHEKVHLEQMGCIKDSSGKYRNDLDYDDNYVYWKGKKYSRAQMKEGAKNLPWEKEAYKKAK
tara:strand:- start:3002 stop:3337 length:336 start_codon:yes stop_codon:yes gene_type:complete